MRRCRVHIAAVLSLVFCTAAVSLWVVSSSRPGGLQLQSPVGLLGVYWGGGTLCLSHADSAYPSWRALRVAPASVPNDWHWFNFYCSSATLEGGGLLFVPHGKMTFRPPVRYRLLGAPLWVIAAPLAVPPAVWVTAWRRRRRRAARGLCLACGFDLRASPQRCPECGTAAA